MSLFRPFVPSRPVSPVGYPVEFRPHDYLPLSGERCVMPKDDPSHPKASPPQDLVRRRDTLRKCKHMLEDIRLAVAQNPPPKAAGVPSVQRREPIPVPGVRSKATAPPPTRLNDAKGAKGRFVSQRSQPDGRYWDLEELPPGNWHGHDHEYWRQTEYCWQPEYWNERYQPYIEGHMWPCACHMCCWKNAQHWMMYARQLQHQVAEMADQMHHLQEATFHCEVGHTTLRPATCDGQRDHDRRGRDHDRRGSDFESLRARVEVLYDRGGHGHGGRGGRVQEDRCGFRRGDRRGGRVQGDRRGGSLDRGRVGRDHDDDDDVIEYTYEYYSYSDDDEYYSEEDVPYTKCPYEPELDEAPAAKEEEGAEGAEVDVLAAKEEGAEVDVLAEDFKGLAVVEEGEEDEEPKETDEFFDCDYDDTIPEWW